MDPELYQDDQLKNCLFTMDDVVKQKGSKLSPS